MRNVLFCSTLALLAMCPVRVGLARWGPAGCSAVAEEVKAIQPAAYRWVKNDKVPGEVYLFLGARQVGGYSFETGFYLPFDGDKWGKPAIAPIRPPLEGMNGDGHGFLFGVNIGELSKVEHFECRDKPRTYAESLAMLGEEVPNDSKQPRLTAIATSKATRDKIRGDWEAAAVLAPARSTWGLQVYDPASPVTREIMRPFKLDDSKALKDKGLVILAQAAAGPDGSSKVLGTWSDYIGADDLAAALRKVDPNFDPNKPLVVPVIPSMPTITEGELLVLCGAAILAVFVLARLRAS